MSISSSTATSQLQSRLWGPRARDWAEHMEGNMQPVYDAVHEQLGA